MHKKLLISSLVLLSLAGHVAAQRQKEPLPDKLYTAISIKLRLLDLCLLGGKLSPRAGNAGVRVIEEGMSRYEVDRERLNDTMAETRQMKGPVHTDICNSMTKEFEP